METKHSAGPWVAESRSVSDGALVVKDAEFNEICVIREKAQRSYGPQDKLDQANAARIVACVNACVRIANPDNMPENLDELGTRFVRANAEREALRAEVERLREALRELDANCENRQDEPFIKYIRQTARAALKQEGKP